MFLFVLIDWVELSWMVACRSNKKLCFLIYALLVIGFHSSQLKHNSNPINQLSLFLFLLISALFLQSHYCSHIINNTKTKERQFNLRKVNEAKWMPGCFGLVCWWVMAAALYRALTSLQSISLIYVADCLLVLLQLSFQLQQPFQFFNLYCLFLASLIGFHFNLIHLFTVFCLQLPP